MPKTLPTAQNPVLILNDCALAALRTLPEACVDTIVTSPPYWGLRDYGIEPTDWPACSYAPMPGLPAIEVPAERSCLGLETTLHAFLAHLVLIFEECRRVLKPTGSAWVNMGDGYANDCFGTGSNNAPCKQHSNKGTTHQLSEKERYRGIPNDLKRKDLIGQPWRVAFALQAAGWYLRQDNIWHKPNPMPESIRDRATKAHEYVFHLTKSERYYFDLEGWAEKATGGVPGNTTHKGESAYLAGDDKQRTKAGLTAYAEKSRKQRKPGGWDTGSGGHGSMHRDGRAQEIEYTEIQSLTRNKRSVWTVPTVAYAEAHYATYPPRLITPPLLASTSAKGCCTACGKPWERVVENTNVVNPAHNGSRFDTGKTGARPTDGAERVQKGERFVKQPTGAWQPTCRCSESPHLPVSLSPCLVLDPFGGSGTTAQVALEHGRHAILIERGPHNVALIHKRLAPFLASPVLNLA